MHKKAGKYRPIILYIYIAIIYPHANIATTIITNTIFCFVANFIFSPHIYQPVVKFWQPKFSPLLKNPSNIPIENNNANPIIIGTPIDFNPSVTLSLPAILPDVIASQPYFANINPAPTNANVRSNLKTSWNRAIMSHNPLFIAGAANAGTTNTAETHAKIAVYNPTFFFGTNKKDKICGKSIIL